MTVRDEISMRFILLRTTINKSDDFAWQLVLHFDPMNHLKKLLKDLHVHAFKESPPGEEWDGVYVMTTK